MKVYIDHEFNIILCEDDRVEFIGTLVYDSSLERFTVVLEEDVSSSVFTEVMSVARNLNEQLKLSKSSKREDYNDCI